MTNLERLGRFDAVEAHLPERCAGRRALQRQCGKIVGDVGNGNVIETEGAHLQPCGTGAAAGEHEFVVSKFEDRAVIDHAAFIGAPEAVERRG